MGALKQFLIRERVKVISNWSDKDHKDYLAWRQSIETEEKSYEQERGKQILHQQKG
jgi:hypothetical protein